MATRRITLNPQPPVQGKDVVVCYDFDGSGMTSTALEVSFDDDPSTSHDVTAEEPCVTIRVPDDATSITVADAKVVSAEENSAVVPP